MINIADKAINFKVDADLYKEIKIKLAKIDKTLKEYVTDLIKEDLEKDKK